MQVVVKMLYEKVVITCRWELRGERTGDVTEQNTELQLLGPLLKEDETLAFGGNFFGGCFQNQTSDLDSAQREIAFRNISTLGKIDTLFRMVLEFF